MPLQSIGDLAQSFTARRQSGQLKQQMARLTRELSSGQTSDLTRHLKGSFRHLADIEHQMQVQDSYRIATEEAALSTAAMQAALGSISSEIGEMTEMAILLDPGGDITADALAGRARNAIGTMLSALNTDVAGRPVFAGDGSDIAPIVDEDNFLSQIRTAIGGASDVAGVRAALDSFFAAGGGFETTVYQGSAQDASPYRLGTGESVRLSIRADDPALRETLKFTAIAALADDPALPPETHWGLAIAARGGLLNQASQVTGLKADLGQAEARIERSATRIATELSSLDLARNQLLSVDPFEAASELENVQFQLEALYTVTARSSSLNLINFLS